MQFWNDKIHDDLEKERQEREELKRKERETQEYQMKQIEEKRGRKFQMSQAEFEMNKKFLEDIAQKKQPLKQTIQMTKLGHDKSK